MKKSTTEKFIEEFNKTLQIVEQNQQLERQSFASDLVFLIDRARRLGLYRTSHRLHDAERELGWELAGQPMPETEPRYSDVADVDRK